MAMVYVLQTFRNYLLGGHFKMYTNYSMMKYLVNNSALGGRYCDGYHFSRNMTLK